VKTSDGATLRASVGALSIIDNLQPYGDEFRYLASSWSQSIVAQATNSPHTDGSHDKLIEIEYHGVSNRSPLYKDIDHAIEFRLNTLHVMVNRPTLKKLASFANRGMCAKPMSRLPVIEVLRHL
jgi:hypothetical protein